MSNSLSINDLEPYDYLGDDEYDYLYKIILIGNAGVGKSNLLSRITKKTFEPNSKTTIGVEFAVKTYRIGNKIIKVQIWDTSGQEKFRAITNAYYRSSNGVLIVYDITNKSTFDAIDFWLEQVDTFTNNDVEIILVGNKCDLENIRQVDQSLIKKYSYDKNMNFIETSAKDNINVDMAFKQIIFNNFKKDEAQSLSTSTMELDRKSQYLKTISIVDNHKNVIPTKKENNCC